LAGQDFVFAQAQLI